MVQLGAEVYWDEEDHTTGEPYPIALRANLEQADAVIAVIVNPKTWADPKSEADGGGYRLQEENDWVRQEVLYALKHPEKLFLRLYIDDACDVHPEVLDTEIVNAGWLDHTPERSRSTDLPVWAEKATALLRERMWTRPDFNFRIREINKVLVNIPDLAQIEGNRALLCYCGAFPKRLQTPTSASLATTSLSISWSTNWRCAVACFRWLAFWRRLGVVKKQFEQSSI